MDMTSLNVSLPKSMKTYVEAQVHAGSYSTPSEYVRTLIRQDQSRKERQRLKLLLLERAMAGKKKTRT